MYHLRKLFVVTLSFALTNALLGSIDSKNVVEQQAEKLAHKAPNRIAHKRFAAMHPSKQVLPRKPKIYNPKLAPIPELSFEPTYTIGPVFKASQATSEKMVLFMQATHANPVNTKKLYHMGQDPVIRALMSDAKTFQELHSLKDDQGKGILNHAIDNNDAPFASLFSQHADAQQRHEAVKYASHKEKPRVMLALIPKLKFESEEDAALSYFSRHGQIPYAAISAALDLIKTHQRDAASYKQKLYAQIVRQEIKQHNETSEKVNADQKLTILDHPTKKIISKDLQKLVLKKLMIPTIDSRLEKAIIDGNENEVDMLLAHGVSVGVYCAISALDLAVYHGHPEIVRKILAKSSYIPKKKQRELIELTQKKMDGVASAAIEHRKNKYEQILLILKGELAAQRLALNFKLKKALLTQNLAGFIKALKAGANPNILHRHANSSFKLIDFDEIFLRFALSFGMNPHVFVANGAYKSPIAYIAIKMNKPKHTQLLFNAGAHAQAIANTRVNNRVLSTIMRNPDTTFIMMLLNPQQKSLQHLSPNSTVIIKNYQDHITGQIIKREVPLLYAAIYVSNLNAAQLLLDMGANPNSRPVVCQAFDNENPAFFKMMLNPRTKQAIKLNPNADMIVDGQKRTLLSIARELNEYEKAQLLIEAGALQTV